GGTLLADHGDWLGAPTGYTFQWQRCDPSGRGCTEIVGAIGRSYLLAAVDIGTQLRVAVTAVGAAAAAVSAPTALVTAAAPTNASPPGIDGTPTEGGKVTAIPGRWLGTAPLAYTYRWQRCDEAGTTCSEIAGATSATYTPYFADVGSRLKAVVGAANGAGTASATSGASVPVAAGTGYTSQQLWPYASRVAALWPGEANGALQPPAIAIVDSGIDASRPDFGGRVIQQVTLTTLTKNSQGDGRGPGTFVASIAAGQLHGRTGAAPNANLVSLDVLNDLGMARM